ncbi:MAG: hypothetical protein K0R38_96 [Polyangiaceae bacterium]|jgi:hypothetical protein|nr:hypothetical protein [Polyangiaceae bacterium]
MVQHQPESQTSASGEVGTRVNEEAIPAEQPNAASPQPKPPIRHEPRPAGRGGLLMLLALLAVGAMALLYALAVRP